VANDDRLTGPLQESVLTLLLFDKRYGAMAAGVLRPEHFDLQFRDIATRALDYRAEYRKPPGAAHVDDIFDHVMGDPKNKLFRTYKNILSGILEQADSINGEYVSKRVHEFVRRQTLKTAVVEAGQRYAQGGSDVVPEVETILYKALKTKNEELDVGTFLGDRRNIPMLLNSTGVTYLTGIPELDARGFGLTRKEAMLFQGVKGTGKSWFLTHLGRNTVMQHGKVCHISLEMRREQVIERYFRNWFAMGKRDEKFTRVRFELDELGKLKSFREIEGSTSKRRLTDPKIKRYLEEKLDKWSDIMDNIVVKTFPSGSLTMAGLEAYLDGLELHRFMPDVLLLDYPMIMSHPKEHIRESLGRTAVELRGLLDRRNMCGAFPVQSNRKGAESKTVEGTNVAEDWSQGFTTDMSLTFSQTKAEKSMNLARLFVDKNRTDVDKFTVLISQNYAQGQFCTDSILMEANRYWDKLKDRTGGEDEQ